jgi:hypothetical protein
MKNTPMYNSTYSFITKVDDKIMEFVSEKEYEEYIESPIKIIKKYFFDGNKTPDFRIKVTFCQRKSDGKYFVYKVSQYLKHPTNKELYMFNNYCDAFKKYQEIGGK